MKPLKRDIETQVSTNSDRITRLEEQGKTIIDSLKRVEDNAVVLRHIIEGNGSPGLKTDMQLLKQSVSTIHQTLLVAAKENLDATNSKKEHLWHWWTAIAVLVATELLRFFVSR